MLTSELIRIKELERKELERKKLVKNNLCLWCQNNRVYVTFCKSCCEILSVRERITICDKLNITGINSNGYKQIK